MCENCQKPESLCVCDRLIELPTRLRVLILQHPQEQDRLLGSARLTVLSLPSASMAVGLSWGSLAHALDEEADPKRWAILYLGSLKRPLSEAEKKKELVVLDKQGHAISGKGLDGIVLLDGSWSQAKALWWRNPWMLKLNRLLLHPKEPSLYGKLRKEPRKECLSTIEATAEALALLGEPEETRVQLKKLFRTLLQRARDVKEPGR